jgi:hypothetical protein
MELRAGLDGAELLPVAWQRKQLPRRPLRTSEFAMLRWLTPIPSQSTRAMDSLTELMNRLDELGDALAAAAQIADDAVRTEMLLALQQEIAQIYQLAKAARDNAAAVR